MIAGTQFKPGLTGWKQFGLEPAASLCVFGMRRAGNHAIINWLLRNPPAHSSGTIFLNNCRPKEDPFEGHKSLEVNGARGRHTDQFLAEAGTSPMVVISYEDQPPPAATDKNIVPRGFEADQIDHRIIVFRSFLNWSASLLKKLRNHPSYTSISRGKIMLTSIERYGRMLARVQKSDLTGICYDSWVISSGYRADVLEQLGLPATDNTLGAVQHYGGGSSFSEEILQGQDLGSHERWAHMVEDSEYLALLWVAAQDADFLKILGETFPVDLEVLEPLIGVRPGLGGA